MATLETDIAADAPGNDVALTFGDIISLMSLSPRSHVTAAGLIDDHVYAEALVAGVKMPPNPRDCRFILKPASNLSEATALRALISRGELQDGDEVTHLKERVALEASHNQLELNRLWGTEVRYGDAIELEHVTSKKYLATCDDQHDGHVSMLGGAALQLETPNEAGLDAHAKLIPAFASHVEGSVICSGHAVILHFTNRGLGFSVPARQAFGGDSPENDALHPHVRERTVVRAQVRPTRLMLIKLCAASAVATNRSLVHGCAAVQLVFNSTREELSVATNDGNEDESAAFGTRLNGNVIKQAVQDEDGDTSYLPSFRKGAPPGLGANSMCWWVLEPTEMFGSCEPAKLGKHRKYRLKHLVTGVYLSASASEGASSDTDSLEALPSFSHDVHGQTLWHLLMMLPEMHSDSGTALLRAGATVFIKSASTGRLICASTNLSSFSDTASVPRMVSHGQGTSESTASFSVRIGSDDEMNQILWARNCQRRLSKFYQLIKQHQTRTKRKSSVIDEPGVALESRFIGMHRQSSSKRRSSVTRLVRNSPSTSKRDMSLSDDGQNDPMLRSLLSRYNEEVEATLSELTIRCTSCDELDPIGRSINGTPVRAVQTLLHEQGTNALVVRLLCALLELSFSHTADIQRVQRIAALCVAMLRCAIRSYPPAQAVVAQHETQLMGHLYAARTETVLMEAYRDNNQLLRAAKLSLPRTFTNAIRKQRKLPEYLLFLQSLCSCYGVPLATTQNMVADALLARPDALAKDSQVTLRVPSQTEVLELWGPTVQSEGGVYYKTTKVHARIALKDGELETVVDGHVETHNKYKKGDFIMCGSRGGQYPMTSENFKKRYEHNHPEPANTEELAEEGFERYRPIGQIWAHTLSTVEVNEHFPARQFMGKWGSPVSVEPGDALAMPFPKGGEVYLIRKSLLSSSYALSEKSNHSKPLRRSSVCIGSPGGNKRKSLLHTELDASGVAKGVFLELKLEEQRGQHQSEGTNVSIRDPDDENDSEWHSMHQFCGPVGMAMASMDMGARATAVRLLRYLCGTYELLAHLCAGRNRRVCDTLLAELVCKRLGTDLKTLSSLVASRCVPHVLRAAAVSLLHALYIDREPHEQRDPIALTRCWGAVDAAAVRGAAAARAAARGVAGTLPQSAVDEAKRQAAKSLLISTEKGHGLNVRFVVVDPFAEFTHIGKVNPSFILDALIGTLESLVPELASDFAAAAASGNKTPRKSSTKNGLVGRKRSQPLERKESSLLLSTNRRTSDGAKLMTSLLKLTETIVRFGCAHLHQLRKLLSPTLGLLAAFGPADRHNDSAVNNKLSSQTATRELSNDSAERCKMLLTGLSVLTLLLDSQLDERLARFQHEYETKGCADFAALLKHPERIELQEHGIAPFTDSHAEQLAQELFDEPILAPELIAAPRTGDETIEIVDKSRNRRRSRALLEPSDAPASNVAPDGVPGPAASMILLGLTRCEDPGVRTLSLELLLRLLSQREAFIARLRQVTYITDDAGATSLRELGYATSELRRLRKWVASDDAQRRKDAVCSARRIVIALTEEMRPNSDRPQSERAHKREMVRHSGCLDHVISLLQIPLELERDDDESDSEEPASPTPAQNQNQTSNESAFPASRSSSRSLSRSLNEPKQNRPEKKPDGVLPLPKAADDDHLALTQACLRFIEEYCSAGIAFQRDVQPHTSLIMSQMGVHHLDAAGAVRSMLRNNEELLTVLSTAVVTAVLELSSNYGRRARWCALLRSVLSTRGRPIAKNQRKMLAILTENRALMLDLEGRHRGSPVDPVPSDANGDQTRKTSDAFRLMSEATQRKQARLERLQLICEREQLHPYNSTLAYHIQTVELLADCAAGNKSLQQFTALVSFERSVKEYVDCGAGSSRFDELQAAEARNQAESTGAFGNRSAGLPPLSNPEKSPSGMSGSRWALGQRHILSVLTVKAAWLRYLTRAYLEYDFVSEAKAKGGDMSSLVGTMRGFVWPDGSDGGADGMYTDRAGGSDSESNSENEGEGDDGPCTTDFRLETDIPSKSILEALALDVENARSWKQSYEQVRNAEVELQAKDAPWSLTPAAGDRRVPDGWESGLFVSEFVADTVASAVRACFENPAFSADEDSSGDQGGAESTRSRQDVSRSERERRDELRMRLGRAIVDFVNDVHAPPMRTAQILALNDLVERYLDPRGELPKIQVNRPEAKRDIELADGTSADSEPRRGARPDGKRVFNFRRFIYARVKEGFLDWSDAFAAAAGVHDTARGLGVGTGASATLFLSPVGQLFMPYVTTSLRVLAACLRHRDLQTLRGGNNASNDLRAAQVTLPFDLVAHAASLGLNCERASVAKAALQADKRGLFKTVLRVFRAMIYVNAAAGEHDTAINAEEAVEQMLCEQPASGDALETTIATALSPQWGLHRVALSFVGLKGMAIPAMRLLVTLLGGAESMGGVQGLAEAQDAILAHAHSSEGATLTAQLQLQMCSVISWAAAHRKTRSLVGAMRSLGTDSEQKDGQNSVIFANGELFEAALMGGSGAMNRLNNTLRGPRNSTVGVSQARWSNRASARNSVLAGGGSPSTPRGRRSSRSSTGFIGPGAMVGNALGLNAPRSPFRQRKFRIFSVPDASAVRGSYPADQKGRRQSKPDMWKAFDAAQLNVVEMAASKLGELRDTNDEASTDMRAAVADHVTTTHDALEQLRFLLLLCRGGHRGIQDWLRSPPRLTPPQDESSDPSVASGLLGLRHLSGDTPPSVSAPPSQSEGPEKSGKENSMDKRLRPSVLESVIAVLEPLVHGLDPADVTEMDLALAALEMLRLLTQGNSRSRDTAVKAGQLRLISRVLTIIGNHTARQHFRVASRRPGDEVDEDEADMRLSVSLNNAENKRASFTVDSPRRRRSSADQRFGPTEDRTAQRRGSNDSRETVGSTTPEPSKGTVKELSSRELLIAHHAHAARGSALRILLSVLQSHGGQRLAPAIMRLVPASVLVGVMHASAVSIVAARDDGQPAFAAVDDEAARLHQQTLVVAEMTDEGFIAYNVLETLLAVGEARMRRAKLGAVTVSSNTAHVGNASDGLVPGRSTSVKGEGTEDEVAARYLDRARVALAVPAIRQAVRNIFKAETGRVEIVAQHIAGSDESSNQDGAVPELMVFRKHKLALQLLNEDRWRTQTLARLSSIPRGDAVSHGVKRKALLAKIDELALEEIAAASFATHRYALVLLQILPPLLACLLNFLTVWCIRVDFDRSWIFADDVRPDHSDPVRIRSNDLPVCNSISILQPMLGAAYSILMIARVAVALGMRRPVLERQWQQHCETAFGVDDEEGDAGDDELEQRMYHQKIIVTGVTGVSQWARVVQLIAPAIGATCGFETIFAVFAVGGVIVGHSGAGGLQFAPVCYSILLLDLARARSTGFVLRSVGGSLRLIAGLLTLLMIVMFIFMSFALASFPGQLECETMLTCVTRGAVFMLLGKSPLMQETNVNIKSGLELDPLLIKPNDGYEVRDNDTRYGWVALNVASFVLLVLLLNSLLTGIIFNQFAKQTDKADALQRDARDVCLVCSLRRGAFEHATAGAGGGSAASAWRAHTLIDHNPIEYVALAISLRLRQTEAHLDEMTSHERYALERLLAHDASVIPIEQCASLASAGREKNTDTQVKELAAQVQLLAASVVGLQGQIKALVAGSHAPPTSDL